MQQPGEGRPTVGIQADLELAKSVLRDYEASFVLASQGRILEVGTGHGVLPLVKAVERIGPDGLQGAVLADKLVGRAAALVAAYAGLSAVYGQFMSQAAMGELARRGIPFTWGVEIPAVLNRSGEHLCPFEELVASAATPEEGMRRLRLAKEKGIRGAALEVLGRLPEGLAELSRAGEPGEAAPSSVARDGGEEQRRLDSGGGPEGRSRALSPAQRVTWGGLWLALGFLLPQLAHGVGLGPAFLLMHIPVLLAGALVGPGIGFIVGVLSPWLSHLATGMPPVVPPIAPLMTIELGALGACAGVLRPVMRRWVGEQGFGWLRQGLMAEYAWLIPTLILGRVALGLAATLFGGVLGLPVPGLVYLQGAIVTGLPGIALQLVLIPGLVLRLSKGFPDFPSRPQDFPREGLE